MKRHLGFFLGLALTLFALPALAALNVFASVPEWAALAKELGGDKVQVYVATNALQDPHHIEAKPSLIARARSADLVIATGAELEVGWLPLVLRQAGNPRVQPGQPGYLEATAFVDLLDKPLRLDRADGDVHPAGNPHIQLDPRNIARVAAPLAARLADLDPANATYYLSRHKAFSARWSTAIALWEKQAASLRGTAIVVHHNAFAYLNAWLGLQQVATLEPKPGIEPTTQHLSAVLNLLQRQPARMVVRAVYQNERASQWIAERAQIHSVVLPFTVGGDDSATDLFGLFDDTIQRLRKGAQ